MIYLMKNVSTWIYLTFYNLMKLMNLIKECKMYTEKVHTHKINVGEMFVLCNLKIHMQNASLILWFDDVLYEKKFTHRNI